MNPLLVRVAVVEGVRHRRGIAAVVLVPVAAFAGAGLLMLSMLTAGSASNSLTATACDASGETRRNNISRPVDNALTAAPGVTVGSLTAAQMRHAATIVQVGRARGVPARGWVVAVATALQESQLRNYASTVYPQTVNDPRAEAVGSDHDSVGLFQQRPQSGWGEPLQLLDPVYAAGGFYGGPAAGRVNRGLLDYPGWEQLPLSEASHLVQRSAFPDAVSKWEPLAREVVAAVEGSPAVELEPALCWGGDAQPVAGGVTAAGAAFTDGARQVLLPRRNPRPTDLAIAWARQEAIAPTRPGGWYRLCSSFVAHAYGWNMSGVVYAIDQWTGMPAAMKAPGDRTPPPGALLFWDTGQRAGHVALYLGGGLIASNDIEAPGRISVVPAAAIEERWGSTYLGWTVPYYAQAG